MQYVTLEIVPLAALKLSPLNARYDRPIDASDLVASIAGAGRVIHPLDCYRDGDAVLVWDGGRRLTALQQLAKAKKLPASLKDGVACLIYPSAAEAGVNSLATFVREGMTAADEFLAFKRLKDGGLSPTEIAAATNTVTRRVEQLLRLCALAPEVLAAFQAGKIPLDVAEALTLTDDHARQVEVLKAFHPKKDSAWGVRSNLRKGAVEARDRWARFVGAKAYEDAGGKFLTDLFNEGEPDFADRELLQRLAKEKLAALVAKVEAEGWQWVQADDNRHYGWDKGFDRIPGDKKSFTLEQKATAGASIHIASNGQPEITRGLVRKAKGKATTEVGQRAQEQPAEFGWGHAGHQKLTEVATGAVQVAVANNPAAAYDAVLTSIAWTALFESGRAGLSRVNDTHNSNAASLRVDDGRYGLQTTAGVAGMDDLVASVKRWRAELPADRLAFCDRVATLSSADKASLLAVCYAWTLNAVETGLHGYQRKPVRWLHLGWIGRHAGVEISAAWTPDFDFLRKGSRAALEEALTEMGGHYIGGAAGEGIHANGKLDAFKKGELASMVSRTAPRVKWVPKLLADLFAKPAPAAKPKGKRMFTDQLAADMAKVAGASDAPADAPTEA